MDSEDEADLRRLIKAEYRRNEFVASTCSGKERFSCYTMASSVAATMTRRRGQLIDPYRCHVCGGWHIGSRAGDSPATKRKKDSRKSNRGIPQ